MIDTEIAVAILALLLAAVGAIFGFLLSDPTSRKADLILFHTMLRVANKAFIRTTNDCMRRILDDSDEAFLRLNSAEREEQADPNGLQAVKRLKDIMQQAYGERLARVYIFGSRARGDFSTWSDVDSLLVFEPMVPLEEAKSKVNWAVFQILLQKGVLIQPRLVNTSEIDVVSSHIHPVIQRALQTGIPV